MKIFNTLTRMKEEFVPIEPGKVRMYVCGPTVYNLIHIGNARPMIFFDSVRRYLEYKGYEVNYVSNFTDVDDKIIAKANEEGVSCEEISERYIKECVKDMEGMNVRPATTHPRATQEIDGMIDMIGRLIEDGYAYIDDSIMCVNEDEGMVFRVSLADIRVRRCIEYAGVGVGDLVVVTFRGGIDLADGNLILDARSIDQASLTENGDAVVPE